MTHRDLYIGLENMLFTANPIYEYELKFSSMQLIQYLELAQTTLINTLSLQDPQESTSYELLKDSLIKSLTITLNTNLDNISGYINIPSEAIKVYGVKLNCLSTYNFNSANSTLPVICDIVDHFTYTKGLIHTDDMSAVIRTPKLTITESKILFTKDQYTTVNSVEIHYVVQPLRFTIDSIQTKLNADGTLLSSPIEVNYSDTLLDLIIETAFKLMISEGVAVFSNNSNQ